MFNFLVRYLILGFIGLGDIASIVGIGSGLSGLFGGDSNSSGSSGAPVYTPSGLGNADSIWQQLLGKSQGTQNDISSLINPSLLSAYQKLAGIDYSPLVNAGNQAGQQYSNLAQLYGNTGQNMLNMGQQQYNQGQDVYNLARDPQNALYDRTLSQGLETTRAGQALRGLGNSAAGQGLEDQFTSNFNIDWQNNQLQRAMQGLQASQKGNQLAGADISAGLGYSSQVPQLTMNSAQAPIDAQTQAANYPRQAALQYSSDMNATNLAPNQSIMSQIIPYLNYGNGAAGESIKQAALNNSGTAADMTSLLTGLKDLGKSNTNNIGSWLSGLWNNGNSYNSGTNNADNVNYNVGDYWSYA